MRIDRSLHESAYLQLYHSLKEEIVKGIRPAGSRLPSRRAMAEEAGVSSITVEHAYDLLLDEGYIISRPKSGYYVSFGETEKDRGRHVRQTRQADPAPVMPITDAPEDFPFTVLARVMRTVLSVQERRILAKSPGTGMYELKETLADYLARSRGMEVTPKQIVVGAGAEYLYGQVVQLIGKEKTYLTEDPCYEKIRRVYQAYGAQTKGLPMGPEGILPTALQGERAGLLHVTPYRSYPSGVTASAARRHEYVRWAYEQDAYLVEDDYDSEFASPTRRIDTVFSLAPDRVIYMGTFTKSLAPSIRMAYMVLPESLQAMYSEKLGFYSCTVPVYDQLVLEAFIREGHLERYIAARRRKMRSMQQ